MAHPTRCIKLVHLDFSAKKPRFVPEGVPRFDETPERFRQRSLRKPSGKKIMDPVPDTDVSELPDALEALGYEFVSLKHLVLLDDYSETGIPTKNVLRAVFCTSEYAHPSSEFLSVKEKMRQKLMEVMTSAAWTAEVYRNPFYWSRKEVSGQYAISFNMNARKPYYYPNGYNVVQWERNKNGKKVGEMPAPVSPRWYLKLYPDGTFEPIPQ